MKLNPGWRNKQEEPRPVTSYSCLLSTFLSIINIFIRESFLQIKCVCRYTVYVFIYLHQIENILEVYFQLLFLLFFSFEYFTYTPTESIP